MADKRRRKSLSLFRQAQKPEPLKTLLSTSASPVEKQEHYLPSPVDSDSSSPKVRPRTLQKANRTSVFGSLRSLHSLEEEERAALTRSDSKASSLHEDGDMNVRGLLGDKLIQHGEVQAGGGNMFRKRTQYLVLTESHLIRFRSPDKAVEMFPSISGSPGRRHAPRTSSISSYQEFQQSAYADITSGIPLNQVVAVFRVDDAKLSFVIEVAYLDERSRRSSSMQIHFSDLRDTEVWIAAIRAASTAAKSILQPRVLQSTAQYVAKVLERERDYDPDHFQVFKVVNRSANKSAGKSSADDLTKFSSVVCYLAIGLHKLHLVPIPRSPSRSSSTSLNDIDATTSVGLVILTSVRIHAEEDTFQLTFKPPMSQPQNLNLVSSSAADIALWLGFASEYLRPEWLRQPIVFAVPEELDETMSPPSFPPEDHNCFDRTLMAYCAGYDVDTSRIYYSVDYECEDAPCFQLLKPATGQSYSNLELLAVFRALRYNESFSAISFNHINLNPLRNLYDPYGSDTDSTLSRSGHPLNITGHEDLPVLCQEIRALALKSRRLRRLDFAYTLPPKPLIGDEQPPDCGILEALVPLCKKSLTNVDWIVLTGLRLSDSDLNYLVDAASERKCHLRALEIGECGLSVHDIDVLLSALSVQELTVEVIDISGAQGRFSPELFHREIGAFSRVRRLNLTRVQKTAGPEPLVAPEALFAWRLESLHLSQIPFNEQTVESLAAYLASPKSDILRELHVNQCGLTGRDLATFFRSMTRTGGLPRAMHVSANENRLKTGGSMLFQAIADSQGPSSLSMRMMDFEKESHFRELIMALGANKTLQSLDISRASLPYDASVETCEALKEMLATNTTLEELDISGEQAHLDAAAFGIGLNIALKGLMKNKTLRHLRIEHQGLGLQGANTLAEVLENNDTLLEIHCEHNDINLQSFTMLVNAVENNHTLLYLPTLDHDRAKTMGKVHRELQGMERAESPKQQKSGSTLKKTIGGALTGKPAATKQPVKQGLRHRHNSSVSSSHSFTEKDVAAVTAALEEKWNAQLERMRKYLHRNYCMAHGIPWEDEPATMDEKRVSLPGGGSLSQMLARVELDRTPKAERHAFFDYAEKKLGDGASDRKSLGVFQLPEDD